MTEEEHKLIDKLRLELKELREENVWLWGELSFLAGHIERLKEFEDEALKKRAKDWLSKNIRPPVFTTPDITGLYNVLFENNYIECNYEKFADYSAMREPIKFNGSRKELSLLTDLIYNTNKWSTISYYFYREEDKEANPYRLQSYYNNDGINTRIFEALLRPFKNN